MRFAKTHKTTTYMMVASAYGAVASSGVLDPLILMLALSGVIISWFWEEPGVRVGRLRLATNIVSALVLITAVLAGLAGFDFLWVTVSFLLYLLVAKLFHRRGTKDYKHIYLLTLLLLVSATVLNAEFTFGLFFFAYVVCSTWALILFHLRREIEDNLLIKHTDVSESQRVAVERVLNSKRIIGGRFLLRTGGVSFIIFLCSAIVFISIPRVGFGLFNKKRRNSLHLAGFSDGVSLGGHGVIKYDRRVVMRVELDDAYKGRSAPYIHWRGVAFDSYSKGSWRRTKDAPRTRVLTTWRENREQHHILYGFEQFARREQRGMRQDVYLEPLGNDVLFSAEIPLAYEFSGTTQWTARRNVHRFVQNDEFRYRHDAGIKYSTYSRMEPPPPDALRAAQGRLPASFDVYTAVPKDITEKTRDLVAQILTTEDNNYDKMRALETWLRDNIGYTLKLEDPGDTEPIHHFLFNRRQGHCEYFSSALAIMARVAGIPTRNVNGFLGGEWNEYDGYIAVRAGDAHSWVEAYFPGHGWVTFDATPASEVDRLGRGGSGWRERLRRFIDTLRFQWFKWVIEYDLYRQISLFKGIGKSLKGAARSITRSLGDAWRWVKRNIAFTLPLALVAVVVITLYRRRRRRSRHGAKWHARRARSKLAGVYESLLAALAKRGHDKPPADTAREFANHLSVVGAPGCGNFAELTEIYYRAEYAPDPPGESTLARARQLRDAIIKELRGK